jgi:hypothetical protein
MKKLWQRWVAILDVREPAQALAAMRLVTAATVFLTFAHAWSSGVAQRLWVDPAVAPIDPGWLRHIGGATWPNVRALLILALSSSALLFFGVFTRVAAILTWLSYRSLIFLSVWSGGSGDNVVANLLFILVLAKSGDAWSLDARFFRVSPTVPAWPRYLAIGQLVTIYVSTGWQKLSAVWMPFGSREAVWLSLQHPIWQRRPMLWFPAWITQIATLSTWSFEIAAPLLILAFYYRATADRPGRVRRFFNRIDFRAKYLAVGFALHVGIELTLEVGDFFGGMIALYCACIHPSEWINLYSRTATATQVMLSRPPAA